MHVPFVRPIELDISAVQRGDTVTLHARGVNNSGGWRTGFHRSPLKIWPPQWMLENAPPEGPATQALTRFEAIVTFQTGQQVTEVIVHLGTERIAVPVQR